MTIKELLKSIDSVMEMGILDEECEIMVENSNTYGDAYSGIIDCHVENEELILEVEE